MNIASNAFRTLRCLHFVIFRMGHASYSAYNFVYLACTDILSSFPAETEMLLREMQPAKLRQIPEHPQERCYDLFFLNLAEQFASILPASVSEELFIAAAKPYLERHNDSRLAEAFEAAHSTFLAVLIAPQCVQVASRYLEYYLMTLFQVSSYGISIYSTSCS